MSLYTERHGMRSPIERTSTITVEMYALLFDCCVKYFDNLAWKFPEECPDGQGCCGLDSQQFGTHMKFDIPTLFRNDNDFIAKPQKSYYGDNDEYDQYALLDLIEYIGHNCKDIAINGFHGFFGHNHIRFLDTDDVAEIYRNEINDIFQKTGLLFALTEDIIVERVIENAILTPEIESTVAGIEEPGTKELLAEAIALYRQPNPTFRNDAVEKLWDALERLKTYYVTDSIDKKVSVTKIVRDMSGGQAVFEQLFEAEFSALTKIGNDYRIRHHETNKIDIQDICHYDYFFNRCLSLIALAIKYLDSGVF